MWIPPGRIGGCVGPFPSFLSRAGIPEALSLLALFGLSSGSGACPFASLHSRPLDPSRPLWGVLCSSGPSISCGIPRGHHPPCLFCGLSGLRRLFPCEGDDQYLYRPTRYRVHPAGPILSRVPSCPKRYAPFASLHHLPLHPGPVHRPHHGAGGGFHLYSALISKEVNPVPPDLWSIFVHHGPSHRVRPPHILSGPFGPL